MSHSVIGNDVAEAIDFLAELFIQKIEGKQRSRQTEGKSNFSNNKGRARSPVIKSNPKDLPSPTQSFGKMPLKTNPGATPNRDANEILKGKNSEKKN